MIHTFLRISTGSFDSIHSQTSVCINICLCILQPNSTGGGQHIHGGALPSSSIVVSYTASPLKPCSVCGILKCTVTVPQVVSRWTWKIQASSVWQSAKSSAPYLPRHSWPPKFIQLSIYLRIVTEFQYMGPSWKTCSIMAKLARGQKSRAEAVHSMRNTLDVYIAGFP